MKEKLPLSYSNTVCVLADLLMDYFFDVRLCLHFSVCAASPKQWEGVGVQLGVNPYFKLDYIDDFDISYDSTNQKVRQTGRITTYNNSSKPVTQLLEQILDYNKVTYREGNDHVGIHYCAGLLACNGRVAESQWLHNGSVTPHYVLPLIKMDCVMMMSRQL